MKERPNLIFPFFQPFHANDTAVSTGVQGRIANLRTRPPSRNRAHLKLNIYKKPDCFLPKREALIVLLVGLGHQ